MNHKLLYIVVLYRMAKEDSPSYRGLSACLSQEELQHDVYVHDNSKRNIYLAGAYNKGLEYAEANSYEWIVLLDEDTLIHSSYISALKTTINDTARNVCVPLLVSEGKVVSPSRLYGIPVALNSGLAIRCNIIRDLGGFNPDYPLDYLDYWLCHRLYDRDISFCVLPIRISHNLSVNTPHQYISKERYLSLLSGEKRYATEFGYVWRYKLHLIGRLVKWSLTGHIFVKETFNALMNR